MEEKKHIVILDENLSYFQITIITSFFLFFIYSIINDMSEHSFSFSIWYFILLFLTFLKPLSFLTFGLAASRKNKVTYFVEENNLQIIIDFFLYKYTKNVPVSQFDYIAVNTNLFTSVTLWYNENKHLKLSGFSKKENAFVYGKALARTLKTDFLNKTDVKNPVWTAYNDL